MGITSLPRKVFHEYRKNKGTKYLVGKVIKEAYAEDLNTIQGDYKHVLQLIKRVDGGSDIRIGYYVKDSNSPESNYHWGSQTTFQADIQIFQELLQKGQEKKIF